MSLWISAFRRDRAPILRAVTALRASARTRTIASVALVALGCVLAFVSFIAVWTRSLVLDTNAYVRAVGPLIDEPVLRDELSVRIAGRATAQSALRELPVVRGDGRGLLRLRPLQRNGSSCHRLP